jgi:hypothetical protein
LREENKENLEKAGNEHPVVTVALPFAILFDDNISTRGKFVWMFA